MGIAVGIICVILFIYFLGSIGAGADYVDHRSHCAKVNDEQRRIR